MARGHVGPVESDHGHHAHGHEHVGHDPGHEHEHVHHSHDRHEHGVKVIMCGDVPVSIDGHLHEDATIATAQFTSPRPLDAIETSVRTILARVTGWVEEQGGFVGHVKASLGQKGPFIMVSMTDAEIVDSKSAAPVVEVEIAAIVFGVELDDLESALGEAITEVEV